MERSQFVREHYIREDEVLRSIRPGLEERGMPQISVPAEVGYTLNWLVRLSGAKRILEVGGLGGYSAIWMARALPAEGKLLSLELEAKHAAFAEENVAKAGLVDQVTYRVGDAKESMVSLREARERFDFFFIDADKKGYPFYLEQAIQLAEPGAVIALDNLFLADRIFAEGEDDPDVEGLLQAHERLSQDPRLDATVWTIGDGLGVARVK
ncbi:O-methyltransferase [Desmospora activa]|uniref:Putative O-methyltransferase YrrM n=1 Tax=Desmospora activa DSM 45169 TaxID=1121389 RepID=A0A2T4ZC28_9BACL|nr:O-methyltransferase [Desmospora activa]PTM59422.1 putative O-methyltransferase YrrM [Desmospora activa DSM 45169]